jgi:sulfate adenylyltransferase
MTTTAASEANRLIDPHGGVLVDLLVDDQPKDELEAEASGLPKWVLTPRQLCDIEQLLTGAFSPLVGFMNRDDYESVRDAMRLANGTLWPMPIVLDVPADFAVSLSGGDRLALMHPEGALIAVLTVGDIWKPDRQDEALKVFATTDEFHPGVNVVMNETAEYYVGGSLEGVRASQHHTYSALRHTPAQLRADFGKRGWSRTVAFQTRNPMHRAHVELTRRAAEQVSANLLIHPVVGLTKPGDVEYHTRVRCYRAVLDGYEKGAATLSLLQLAMRMGGPREAVWHAIVRKNYGCTHFIVGRDHAGPGNDRSGNPFYGPYDAQALVEEHRDELGIDVVTFQEVVYDGSKDLYVTRDELDDHSKVMSLSGTELRARLQSGAEIPEWFSYPSVIRELRKSYPAMTERGFNVYVSGSCVAANSSLANAMAEMLLEDGTRPVTVLDDPTLSPDTVNLVAREASRNGGAVISVQHEPTVDAIDVAKEIASANGVFVSVRRNVLQNASDEADIVIDSHSSPGEGASIVIKHLASLGLVS